MTTGTLTRALILTFSLSPALGSEDAPLAAGPAKPIYRKVQLASAQEAKQVARDLGSEGLSILQKVNRRDLNHMRRGTELQVPVEAVNLLQFSPFPDSIPGLENLPKTILVSLRIQAFAAFERGRLVMWGPVSTGTRKQSTPPNLYYTNWKSRRKVSTINSSWIMPWYFNLHTSMGIAFHQYAMPGYPASYGCIRLLKEDAVWIFQWADPGAPSDGGWARPKAYGTPVIVFGEYRYQESPPWSSLDLNPAATDLEPAELELILDQYAWALETRNGIVSERISGGEPGAVEAAEARPDSPGTHR